MAKVDFNEFEDLEAAYRLTVYDLNSATHARGHSADLIERVHFTLKIAVLRDRLADIHRRQVAWADRYFGASLTKPS